MDALRSSALAAQEDTDASCAHAKTASSFENVVFHQQPPAGGSLRIDLTCASLCSYRARLIDLHGGRTVARLDGEGQGVQEIPIAAANLRTGDYQYSVRTSSAGRPGASVVRSSRPFAITAPPLVTDESSAVPPQDVPLPAEALLPLLPLLPLVPAFPTLEPVVP